MWTYVPYIVRPSTTDRYDFASVEEGSVTKYPDANADESIHHGKDLL